MTGRKRKPRNKAEVNRFWNFIANQEENNAELLLYGEISDTSWYGDEITPAEFNNDLKAVDTAIREYYGLTKQEEKS